MMRPYGFLLTDTHDNLIPEQIPHYMLQYGYWSMHLDNLEEISQATDTNDKKTIIPPALLAR